MTSELGVVDGEMESGAIAVDRTETQQLLHDFMLTILEPETLEGLLHALPAAFRSLLPDEIRCEVQLAPLSGDTVVADVNARACVPLRHGSDLLGAILLCWDQSVIFDARRDVLLCDAAELTAAAIASRRTSDENRERVRAEAADVKFDLIGMLAHEMRTPLASIKGYSSALLLDELDLDHSTTVEFLQSIDEESDHLTEMVTHLLDSTVIEAGALQLHREPILLPALVRRTIEVISRRTDRHRLVTSFDDGIPAVFADEQRIQQVLNNLLDNAIKYSPDGGLILVRGRSYGTEVMVQVSDQGAGIAPEHLNKLFERFFRTERRRAHGVSGTGLGLPIADAIVRAHGGRIWAESAIDEGTTLSFTLPSVTAEMGSEADGNRAD